MWLWTLEYSSETSNILVMFKVGYGYYNRLENKSDNQIGRSYSRFFAKINTAQL
jgi:hypothetical protein